MANTTIRAILGPTNTGKTHVALERLKAHRTGIIGLPLRLLAREVYDKLVGQLGSSVVALVTGEEKIVPPRAAYWVCTVEAMPLGVGADIVVVDEIQLCADLERGHVFTDRLLHARGQLETLFLGSDTIRPKLKALVPEAIIERRERLSTLSYAGSKKLSRMPERAAIVGFSVDEVYGIAELLRRLKGGAAVVMGALSPRTRNAQVDMYQNGDVAYLVATDAIGMGLNLDVHHVAFAGVYKFDGRTTRALMAHEMGQIAGRAGRYMRDGTFGETGDVDAFDAPVVQAVEAGRFAPIQRLNWRNSALEFGTVNRLIGALEMAPTEEGLVRAREADDLRALKTLADQAEVQDRLGHPDEVRLLWEVAQIPDFRRISHSDHTGLLATLFDYLTSNSGQISADWLGGQLKKINNTHGDIDTLSKRLAFVRTWTYVSQRNGWVEDASHWQSETRDIEDRLSDALHQALTARFVDRRTSVLMRRLKQGTKLVAEVNTDGEIRVDEQFVGRIDGFRFIADKNATGDEAKTIRAAAAQALGPEFSLRADRLYNAPDAEIDLTEQGGLMWGEIAVGKLRAGTDVLAPQIDVFVDEEAGTEVIEKVRRRLSHWLDRRIESLFEPLMNIRKDESLTGLAKGVGFQLVEALGVVERKDIADDIKALDQDARSSLRKHGVRFGQYTIFAPLVLKPAPTRMRLVLSSLFEGADEFPASPPPGLVTIPADAATSDAVLTRSGYRRAGDRAIRVDMVERLADLIRAENARAGFEASPDMLSITGLTLEQFAGLMQGMGYAAERGEREKVKAVPAGDAASEAPAQDAAQGTAQDAVEPAVESTATDKEAEPADPPADTPSAPEPEADPVPEAVTEAAAEPEQTAAPEGDAAKDADPQVETFYTFKWVPPRRANARPNPRQGSDAGAGAEGGQDRERGKSRRNNNKDGYKGGGKPGKKPKRGGKPAQHASSGPKSGKAKEVDPDNPFAALMALKNKS